MIKHRYTVLLLGGMCAALVYVVVSIALTINVLWQSGKSSDYRPGLIQNLASEKGPDSLSFALEKVITHKEQVQPANSEIPRVAESPQQETDPALAANLEMPFDIYINFISQTRDPTMALNKIKRDLNDVSKQRNAPVLKSMLIQAAGTLATKFPDQASLVEEMTLREITSSVVSDARHSPGRNPGSLGYEGSAPYSEIDNHAAEERFFVTTAHSVFLSNTTAPQAALEGTLEGVAAQHDPIVREIFVRQFIQKHPALRAEVLKALADRGIMINI